jgi:hypothetical protein
MGLDGAKYSLGVPSGESRGAPDRFAQKAGFVGWAHANKRFKIASADSDDD